MQQGMLQPRGWTVNPGPRPLPCPYLLPCRHGADGAGCGGGHFVPCVFLSCDFFVQKEAIMLLADIIARPEHAAAAPKFIHWCGYMEANLDFSLKNSVLHAMPHCARVLLHALRIAAAEGYEDVEEALCHAAIFHDTRRRSENREPGHGARAAYYYIHFCREKGLAYSQRAATLMTWHDQDDADGVQAIRNIAERERKDWLTAYRIFKDADALDRVRLGADGLNPKMLRTVSARSMTDFARQLYWES